jgi:hypothetical protein
MRRLDQPAILVVRPCPIWKESIKLDYRQEIIHHARCCLDHLTCKQTPAPTKNHTILRQQTSKQTRNFCSRQRRIFFRIEGNSDLMTQ